MFFVFWCFLFVHLFVFIVAKLQGKGTWGGGKATPLLLCDKKIEFQGNRWKGFGNPLIYLGSLFATRNVFISIGLLFETRITFCFGGSLAALRRPLEATGGHWKPLDATGGN